MSNQLSQLPLEVLVVSDVPISARLSQVPLEVLVLSNVPIPAQISQLPLEILHSATPEILVSERVELFVWMPV
jgi:hypothetical protein